MNKTTARDIMAKKLVTVRPDVNVCDAIATLLQNNISGAPVVDAEGNFLGIFSEKSCMRVLITDRYHEMPNGTVEAYMFREPRTISPDADVLQVAQIFLTEPFRRLPVIENGRLIGQVSRRDVLRAMSAEYATAGRSASRPPKQALYLSAIDQSPQDIPVG